MIQKREENIFSELKKTIAKEKKISNAMIHYLKELDRVENLKTKRDILSNIILLRNSLKKENDKILTLLEKIKLGGKLKKEEASLWEKEKGDEIEQPESIKSKKTEVFSKELPKLTDLERKIVRRLKKRNIIKIEKQSKPSQYVKFASRLFSNFSKSLLKNKFAKRLEENLIKANLKFISISYLSTIFLTTLISFFVAMGAVLFFLFFNFGANWPIITLSNEDILSRLLKTFWLLFVIPLVTLLGMYIYPSLEKKSIGDKIDQELPFATIHMSAISGSMIDPSKIFSIIILTGEYPHLKKEFTKLLNEINVYGYDLVTALRNVAYNTPSKKLSELLNGLATTINSGGDLPNFFNKRSETLLFDYKIEREKRSKSAETFMDIYISVVIAAPMILMFLLMIISISGLGFNLSTSMLSLIMVLGVTTVNILFLTFLHIKNPTD